MPPRPRLLTLPFILVTASAFAYFTAYATLLPVLPPYVDDELARGKVAVGITSAAFALSALLARPFMGWLGDRRGRRVLVVGGTALVAVSVAGIAAVDSLQPLIALRLVGGVGEAMFFVGAATAISDLAPPDRRAEAVSLFSVSLYTGVALGPSLGEWLLERRGFDSVWITAALLTAVATLLAVRMPDLKPEREGAAVRGIRGLLHPAGRAPGLVMLTSVCGFAFYGTFVERYASEELSIENVRGVFLLYGAIIVGIRSLGARIPDRYGIERIGIVGLSGSMAGLLLLGLWPTMSGLLAGSAVFAVGQAFAFPAFMAIAANGAPPSERAAAVATMTAFVDLGFFLGPLTLGVVVAQLGYRSAFAAAGVIAGAGLLLQIVRRARPAAGGEVTVPATPG